jgi:sigma-B regulation protein RsbU (phosphoserine phosphatase)
VLARLESFWERISDGIAVQQLWLQLRNEARASYRLYAKDIDWSAGPDGSRRRRFVRAASDLFWAMVLKLSPERRVVLVIALVLLFFPGIEFAYRGVQFQIPNLAFFSALLLLILVALELADRVVMKRDLQIAKEIQTWLMPAFPPQLPGIEMAFATRPANTVAGDYYDAFLRPTAGDACPPLLFVVADVAGKSIPAALLMATLQASLRTLSGICGSMQELIGRWNRYCCEQNAGGRRFTTAFLAEFDPPTRRLTYVNAGHNWPVLLRASGAIERLQTGGIPIGMMPEAPYESAQLTLGAGDLLVVFTDGLVEAEDARENQFGEARMLAVLNHCKSLPPSAILNELIASADRFSGSAPQHDDITCLVFRC